MIPYRQSLNDALRVFESLATLDHSLFSAASLCSEALQNGRKLLICGNGGSAAEAQHLVGELMGRFRRNRPALPAIALTTDSCLVTCIANDYSYEDLFARQVQGLGRPGDVLIVFTTSGCSPNVLRALDVANQLGLATIAFLGRDGGPARELAACPLIVRDADTARIQEGHQFLMHCLMEEIESAMFNGVLAETVTVSGGDAQITGRD